MNGLLGQSLPRSDEFDPNKVVFTWPETHLAGHTAALAVDETRYGAFLHSEPLERSLLQDDEAEAPGLGGSEPVSSMPGRSTTRSRRSSSR